MKHWDPTAGEALYSIYRRRILRNANGNNVASVTQSQGLPGPEPVDYRALPPRAKAFWQEVAQEFIDGLPEPRIADVMLGRRGR